MNSKILAALLAGSFLVLGIAQTASAQCCGASLAIAGEEQILFITMNEGTDQRVVKVCQGGGPPATTFDIYWCLCDEPVGTVCVFQRYH